MQQRSLIRIVVALAIYLGITYLGGDIGRTIMYPIRLLVTFLHELGHALGAIFTGGEVLNLQVSEDGSGYTTTRGGIRSVVLMGGYLGSALLGNILLYLGVRQQNGAKYAMYILALAMLFSGLFWHNSMFTTGILLLFCAVLFFIAYKTNIYAEVLMFLGMACVIYIIQDFNIGPRSDLEKYAELFVFPPAQVWMYIWLVIAIVVTVFNLRAIFRKSA